MKFLITLACVALAAAAPEADPALLLNSGLIAPASTLPLARTIAAPLPLVRSAPLVSTGLPLVRSGLISAAPAVSTLTTSSLIAPVSLSSSVLGARLLKREAEAEPEADPSLILSNGLLTPRAVVAAPNILAKDAGVIETDLLPANTAINGPSGIIKGPDAVAIAAPIAMPLAARTLATPLAATTLSAPLMTSTLSSPLGVTLNSGLMLNNGLIGAPALTSAGLLSAPALATSALRLVKREAEAEPGLVLPNIQANGLTISNPLLGPQAVISAPGVRAAEKGVVETQLLPINSAIEGPSGIIKGPTAVPVVAKTIVAAPRMTVAAPAISYAAAPSLAVSSPIVSTRSIISSPIMSSGLINSGLIL